MILSDKKIEEISSRIDFVSRFERIGYIYGMKRYRDICENKLNSELAILLSRHVHDRCGDNVPNDIGLTLLEVIKNYKKGG